MTGGSHTTAGRRDLPRVPRRASVIRVVFSAQPSAVGRSLALDGTDWTLGRLGTGAAAIEDARLSREHLRITLEPAQAGYVIEDLGSSNGTFIDGRRVADRALVAAGQVISAGDTLMVVDEDPGLDRFPGSPSAPADAAHEIRGTSFAAARWRRAVATVATAKGSVLLRGPSGAGKEVSAREIHRLSGRKGRLVSVNCAAIPAELAESELFGHKRGAFTGADADRTGLFVEAHGGTLFLDEIGDLERLLQAKLLRVIEEGVVQPVGGGAARNVDVRVVAATLVDLETSGFRPDLYARISDWVLRLPSLSERRADVLPLFDHFVEVESGATQPYTAELAEALLLHEWPLNAREVRQLARRLITVGAEDELWDLDLLPEPMQRPVRSREVAEGGAPDRGALEAALIAARGNVSKVAEDLGKDRKQVYRWLRRAGLNAASYR